MWSIGLFSCVQVALILACAVTIFFVPLSSSRLLPCHCFERLYLFLNFLRSTARNFFYERGRSGLIISLPSCYVILRLPTLSFLCYCYSSSSLLLLLFYHSIISPTFSCNCCDHQIVDACEVFIIIIGRIFPAFPEYFSKSLVAKKTSYRKCKLCNYTRHSESFTVLIRPEFSGG